MARAWSRPTVSSPNARRGLPARCATSSASQPGDRVAIAAKNTPDYLALFYGIWHAGLAAVPANAKLHGSELAYILEHSGARVCFASSGIDSRHRAARAQDAGAADHHRQRRIRRAVRGGRNRARAARARRSRLAVLHLGHHRPAERRDAVAPSLAQGELRLCGRGRSGHAGRCHPACRAHEPRLRLLHHAAHRAARRAGGAGERRLRARRDCARCSTIGRACRCSPRPP